MGITLCIKFYNFVYQGKLVVNKLESQWKFLYLLFIPVIATSPIEEILWTTYRIMETNEGPPWYVVSRVQGPPPKTTSKGQWKTKRPSPYIIPWNNSPLKKNLTTEPGNYSGSSCSIGNITIETSGRTNLRMDTLWYDRKHYAGWEARR